MCLDGEVSRQGVEVRTVKDHFFWHAAAGAKCDAMKAKQLATAAAEHQADFVTLPHFTASEASDYQSNPATLSVCSVVVLKSEA